MSKEKSGKINSDEEYGSEDELITHELAGLDLNSSESKSSPSPTVVRSTPTNPRNTPVRASSTGSQTGSTSSKENTPSRASSRTSNLLLNPITSRESMGSLGSLGSAAMGSDEELREQDDRFIEQNKWTQQQLQENRPGTSLGFAPGVGLTSGPYPNDEQKKTIDMSGRSFQEMRDKSRSLSTLKEGSEDDSSAQSSAAASRVPSRNSFSSLVSPRSVNRKQLAPFPGESLTETSQDSGMEKETSESSGDRSPGRKNKRSLSSPQQGFVSLDTISNKRRKGNYVKPIVPIPKSSVPDELQEQLYEVWDEEKEDYENYRLLKARQDREARRELKKKGRKKVEAAGAGSDSDSDSYDEEIDAEYRELINLFSGEFEAFVAVINTGLYDPDRVNAETFFELMSFWLSLYYNINTTLRHRQVLINYLIEIRGAIAGISVIASNPSGRDNRQLIYFIHFLDELLTETRKEQQDYMNNKRNQMRGGSKKRKTRKRTTFKKTSRKTAKRNVKSKPKRKAARKIKLTRKKKVTTKKRKFIKTKRSLKTNKKIRTRKR